MSVLYVTQPAEDGMVAVILDEPHSCGWPETILHVWPDGREERGCANCGPESSDSGSDS